MLCTGAASNPCPGNLSLEHRGSPCAAPGLQGNKWSNLEYWEHTGLKEYMPYMYGGGYIFSGDIARALHLTNKVGIMGGLQQASSSLWAGRMLVVCRW